MNNLIRILQRAEASRAMAENTQLFGCLNAVVWATGPSGIPGIQGQWAKGGRIHLGRQGLEGSLCIYDIQENKTQ